MNVVGKDILKVARALGVGSGAAEVSDSGNRATPDTAGPPQLKTKAIFGLGLLSETYPDPYPYTLNWRFEFESKGQPCAQNFFQLLGADTMQPGSELLHKIYQWAPGANCAERDRGMSPDCRLSGWPAAVKRYMHEIEVQGMLK